MLIARHFNGMGWPLQVSERGAMKIYLLMVLISVIAALSHYTAEPQSPERPL